MKLWKQVKSTQRFLLKSIKTTIPANNPSPVSVYHTTKREYFSLRCQSIVFRDACVYFLTSNFSEAKEWKSACKANSQQHTTHNNSIHFIRTLTLPANCRHVSGILRKTQESRVFLFSRLSKCAMVQWYWNNVWKFKSKDDRRQPSEKWKRMNRLGKNIYSCGSLLYSSGRSSYGSNLLREFKLQTFHHRHFFSSFLFAIILSLDFISWYEIIAIVAIAKKCNRNPKKISSHDQSLS